MALYWRDLLAWQQIQDNGVGPLNSIGYLQLCQQDPARIYLSISLQTPTTHVVPITTNPGSGPNPFGLILGCAYNGTDGIVQAISLAMRNLTTQTGIASGSLTVDFPTPPGTGTIRDGSPPLVLGTVVPELGSDVPINVTPMTWLNQPGRYEFFVAKHGALAQAAWYAWCLDGNELFHVLAVRQDSGPCDTGPLKSVMAPAKPQTVSWLDSMAREDNSNGVSQGSTAKSVKSVFRPNWDGISPNSGTE